MPLVPKVIFVLEEGGHASQLPSFGGPVDPSYGVPAPGHPSQGLPGLPPHPSHGLPGLPHRPEQGLPPLPAVPMPPIYVPPDTDPSYGIPIAPSFPPHPSHGLPGRPPRPDQGLPGSGARPDQELPEGPSTKPAKPGRNGHVLIWFPGFGYVWFELPSGARPDQELPDTPEPK